MKSILLCMIGMMMSLLAGDITIAVATNASDVIKPLIQAFHSNHPNIKIKVILGSSGKLTAQISHGAPYGLFMSADMKYPQTLYKKGLAKHKPVTYAQGTLALFTTKRFDIHKGLQILVQSNIHQIAIANPKIAPYGLAALEALTNAKLYHAIAYKFVYAESISQTFTYAINAVDIGIVAKSSLFSPKMQQYKKNTHWIEIPTSLYMPIDQGIVMLKESIEIKAFYDFVLSMQAKEILKSFGYKI